MSHSLPLAQEEYFDEVNYQGKMIKVGDRVVVPQAGKERVVEVRSIVKRQGHYWVGYDEKDHVCPWPLVRPLSGGGQ